jgi:hypothetical protein
MLERVLTFDRLKWASFAHSTIYALLLISWLAPGLEGPTRIFGWGHGIMWIGMSLAVLAAARRRIVSLRLAVLVAIVGAFGPFAGSAGFVWERRHGRGTRSVQSAL